MSLTRKPDSSNSESTRPTTDPEDSNNRSVSKEKIPQEKSERALQKILVSKGLKISPVISDLIENLERILRVQRIRPQNMTCILKQTSPLSNKLKVIYSNPEFILKDYHMITKISIHITNRPVRIRFMTYLIHPDLRPLNIVGTYTKKLIQKNLLKCNSTIKFGSFSLDPNGSIKFQAFGTYEISGNFTLSNYVDLEKWIKISHATTTSTIKSNLARVLRLAELIKNDEYEAVAGGSNPNTKKIPPFKEEIEKFLLRVLSNFCTRLEDKTKSSPKIEIINEYSPANIVIMNNFNPDMKKLIEKSDVMKKSNEELEKTPPFYKKISLKNGDYTSKLNSGGYADVHIIEAQFEIDGQQERRKLIMKVPKKDGTKNTQSGSIPRQMNEQDYVKDLMKKNINDLSTYQIDILRINNEKQVLAFPNDKRFPFIGQYFDDPRKAAIFMEIYLPTNMQSITSKQNFGLPVIFNWAFQISQYLIYAKNNGIMHLDFKPENICLTKSLQVKVIDFAESFIYSQERKEIIGVDLKTLPRGYTLPYTAPEILIKTEDASIESDVFAFSHILYTMLLHKRVFGVKRSSNAKLLQRYKTNTYKAVEFKNNLNTIGPKFIMKYIYFIIHFGIVFHRINRIAPEDLMILFEELFKLSEKLY